MKTDRLVNKLNRRIEERYPLEIQQEASEEEGISIWKGKRILPVDQWLKMIASLENDKVVFDLSKGFDYFPDSTTDVVFQYNVKGSEEYYKEIPKETFDNWFDDYLDLLTFKRNPELGRTICRNCLLDPTKDKSGLRIGIHKMVAKVLQKELGSNSTLPGDHKQTSKYLSQNVLMYPCNVLNYFSCPYQRINGGVQFDNQSRLDIEFLFELEQITHLVDKSLLHASTMTKSNESVYEIDVERNTVNELQTLYNRKQFTMMQYSPIEKGLNKIEKQSVIPVRNKEDILEILQDGDKLDKILKQGLSNEDYQKWSNNILSFFEKIREKLKFDFRFKYDVYKNLEKHRCKHCDQTGNIHIIKHEDWYCIKHVKR